MLTNLCKTEVLFLFQGLLLMFVQFVMPRELCKLTRLGDSKGRIVGGESVAKHELPYQLLLINRKGLGNFCGAVVLNATHALTAGHCIPDARASQLEIYGGVHDRGSDSYTKDSIVQDPNVQFREVSQVIEHPRYRDCLTGCGGRPHLKNDIAMLELSEPFTFNEYVRPIKLATKDTKLPSSVLISGWGCMSQDRKECKNPKARPKFLQKVTVSVYSDKNCAAHIGLVGDIYTYQICAGDDGRGACSGDSGGPMVIDNNGDKTLVGIASFATLDCACDGWPTVYTEVSHYLPWINYGIDDTKEEVVHGSFDGGSLIFNQKIYVLVSITIVSCLIRNN